MKVDVYCEGKILKEINVTLQYRTDDSKILNFGWPIEYYFDENFIKRIREECGKQGKKFIIDIGGRIFSTTKRKDPTVYIRPEDMVSLVNYFDEIDKLKMENINNSKFLDGLKNIIRKIKIKYNKILMKTEKFKKEVRFDPAYDKRNIEPGKDYGIHGVDLRMFLKGRRGVVQFVAFTNWYLPHVTREFLDKPIISKMELESIFLPLPADIGYHSPKPMDKYDYPITDNCEVLGGKPCYYDGSGMQARRIYEILLEEGDKGVWRELEDYYYNVFYRD